MLFSFLTPLCPTQQKEKKGGKKKIKTNFEVIVTDKQNKFFSQAKCVQKYTLHYLLHISVLMSLFDIQIRLMH